jgi:hypothetical protein
MPPYGFKASQVCSRSKAHAGAILAPLVGAFANRRGRRRKASEPSLPFET